MDTVTALRLFVRGTIDALREAIAASLDNIDARAQAKGAKKSNSLCCLKAFLCELCALARTSFYLEHWLSFSFTNVIASFKSSEPL